MKLFMLSLIASLLMIPIALAPQTKPSFSVRVTVSCDDLSTESGIKSYVKRELRSLGDVEVVEEEYAFTIHIVALKDHTTSGRHNGYAMSYVFTNRVLC